MRQSSNELIDAVSRQHLPSRRRQPILKAVEPLEEISDPAAKFLAVCSQLEIQPSETLEGSELISVISEFSNVDRTDIKNIFSALKEIAAIQLGVGNHYKVIINGLVSLERKPRKNNAHRIAASCENELRNLILDSQAEKTQNDK